MATSTEQVSAKEVQDFLKTPTVGGNVELPITADDLGLAEQAAPETKEDPKILPPDPTYSEGNSAAKMIAEILRTPKLEEKDLQLTDIEKEIYLKAMMEDAPVVFDIYIPSLKTSVKIRSRNNFEQAMAVHAIKKDSDEGLVADYSTHNLRMMQYSAMFQLLNFGTKVIPHIAFETPITHSEAIKQMRDMLPTYERMGPKWNVYLTALQIFEGKLALAGTQILNKDFFHPAG